MPRSDDSMDGFAGSESKIVVPRAGKTDPASDMVTNEQVHMREPPTTFFGKFAYSVSSMWSTRTMTSSKDSDIMIRTTLRELIIYIIFLILLCIVTFGMMSASMYYYTSAMSGLFTGSQDSNEVNFLSEGSMADYWSVLQGPILSGLYSTTWYNGQNFSDEDLGFVLNENRILGVPRLRQLRMRNDSCIVPSDFQDTILECFDMYTQRLEDKKPFGPANDNGTAWRYHTSSELKGSGYTGEIASYGGGGYYADLMHTMDDASATVQNLMNNLWIDRGTRVVFLDFTLYNANINLFCVIKLVAEFPASGGVVTSSVFRTVKLLRYVSPADYFVMACEILFMLLVVYYIVEEIIEIKQHKLKYFMEFSNIMDVVILIMAICCAAFSIYRTISVNSLLDRMLKDPDSFPDFEFLSYWQETFNSTLAIMLFASWIKIFKYISFNKTMTQLSSTMGKCSKDLAGFAVMFFIIFLAFAQLGYLLFGSQLQAYSSFEDCIFTLFRLILGDFDFDSMQQANRVLGPAYFIIYVFFVFFILLNMFLAIINDTYSEVKSDLAEQKNELEMGDFFRKGAFKMMERLNIKKERVMDLEKAMETGDMNGDGIVDYEEWRTNMKTRGYAEAEIEAVFAKYDVDGDRGLDFGEQRNMQRDLETQKNAIDSELVSSEPRRRGRSLQADSEELAVLRNKVESFERSVGDCLSRFDAVLGKLDKMERAQAKRRNIMSTLLDSITETDNGTPDPRREHLARMIREEIGNGGEEQGSGPTVTAISQRPRSARGFE